ncbi:MAG TPA: hypothetical protein VK401_07660 [Propionibacteriaceae bacterium]|nr:hypothetical protein [Propionibacteriaceae bacterium]
MISALVQELAGWIERLPPRQERMEALAATLRQDFGQRHEPVTAGAVTGIEGAAHRYCRHLMLHFHPDGNLVVDRTPPGWPPDDAGEIRRHAWPISSVRRTEDGLALVAVDSMPSFAHSRPFVEAVIALAGGARGVALDLRHNGGGDPETVATIVGWLCGAGLDISEVFYRDRVRHWTTRRPEPPRRHSGRHPDQRPDLLLRRGAGLPPAGPPPRPGDRPDHARRGRPRDPGERDSAGPGDPARGVRRGRSDRRQLGGHRRTPRHRDERGRHRGNGPRHVASGHTMSG